MTLASLVNGGAERTNDEVFKLVSAANRINRHYSPYQFGSRNPYEASYDEPNPHHSPYQSGHESQPLPHEQTSGQYAAPTFNQNLYSTLDGDVHRYSHSSNRNTQMSMSALTLLAFLFFINMLQSCLREQMHTRNPTVMVMQASGSARFKKAGTSSMHFDENKELDENIDDNDEITLSAPVAGDKMEFLTNDQDDIFHQPSKTISNKLTNSFIEEKELPDKINN